MNRFSETDFFILLQNAAGQNIDTYALETLYKEFACSVLNATARSQDKAETIRVLFYTQIEFNALREILDTEPNSVSVKICLKKTSELLATQIEWLKTQILEEQRTPDCPVDKLKWSGKSIDFVELVYALHFSGRLEETTLKTTFQILSKTFNISITEFSRMYIDIRNRVNRAKFLDEMKHILTEKMDAADNRPSKK